MKLSQKLAQIARVMPPGLHRDGIGRLAQEAQQLEEELDLIKGTGRGKPVGMFNTEPEHVWAVVSDQPVECSKCGISMYGDVKHMCGEDVSDEHKP